MYLRVHQRAPDRALVRRRAPLLAVARHIAACVAHLHALAMEACLAPAPLWAMPRRIQDNQAFLVELVHAVGHHLQNLKYFTTAIPEWFKYLAALDGAFAVFRGKASFAAIVVLAAVLFDALEVVAELAELAVVHLGGDGWGVEGARSRQEGKKRRRGVRPEGRGAAGHHHVVPGWNMPVTFSSSRGCPHLSTTAHRTVICNRTTYIHTVQL